MPCRLHQLWVGVLIIYLTSPFDQVTTVHGQERYCSPSLLSEGTTRGLCGTDLSDTIETLCSFGGKRSVGKHSSGTKNGLDALTVPKSHALSFIDVNKRDDSVGIYCECCVHLCSYSELMGYCSFSSKRSGVARVNTAVRSQTSSKSKSSNLRGFQKRTRYKNRRVK